MNTAQLNDLETVLSKATSDGETKVAELARGLLFYALTSGSRTQSLQDSWQERARSFRREALDTRKTTQQKDQLQTKANTTIACIDDLEIFNSNHALLRSFSADQLTKALAMQDALDALRAHRRELLITGSKIITGSGLPESVVERGFQSMVEELNNQINQQSTLIDQL